MPADDPTATEPVDDQREVVAFLSDPASYEPRPDRVERIDTHGAMVFLAGERAWKIKRAVRFSFMDFSTLEQRRAACDTELAVNRRTAPSLYHGLVPVTRAADGRLRFGGDGAALEWVVVMRRFPQEALLDEMASEGRVTAELIRELADGVAAFHDAAERAPSKFRWGGAGAFRQTIEENLASLAAETDWYPPDAVADLAARMRAALERMAPLLDRRKADGFVRRCHGDLHLHNICLLDGRPTPFDAIDFNDRLAWIDVADDIAFLLMDLEHRGLRAFANTVLGRWVVATGDVDALAPLPLFLADRALVRAKVAPPMARASGDPARTAQLREEGRAYLAAARAYVDPPPARLVAVGGVSGTGKSTLAARLAPAVGRSPGALHLRTDVLRKRLAGVAETDRLPPESYTPESHARVYGVLADWTSRALAAGHAVIVDGVFGLPEGRAAIERLARTAGVAFQGFWLEAPRAVLLDRVAARSGDASDAGPTVVENQLRGRFGPIGWTRIATDRGIDAVEAEARRQLGLAGTD